MHGVGDQPPAAMSETMTALAPDVGLVVGGGATPETIGAFTPSASAVIVGTYLHRDGDERLPVDLARARRILAAASQS